MWPFSWFAKRKAAKVEAAAAAQRARQVWLRERLTMQARQVKADYQGTLQVTPARPIDPPESVSAPFSDAGPATWPGTRPPYAD